MPHYTDQLSDAPLNFVREVTPQLLPGGTLLDLGAGNGRHAAYFARNGFSVTALEGSAHCVRNLEIRFKKEKALYPIQPKIKFTDIATYQWPEIFETTVGLFFFHLLPTTAAHKAIQKAIENTPSGGHHLMGILPNFGDAFENMRRRKRDRFFPSIEELKEIYQKGWNILQWREEDAQLMDKEAPHQTVIYLLARKNDR